MSEELGEGRFVNYATIDLAGQCRMQARDNLDPEYSQFMNAVATRLESLVTRSPAAAPPPPDAGEVRTYREGVREQGQREGFAAAVQWLRDRSAMKPNPPLTDEALTLADWMEQSRIPGAATRR